MKVDLRRAGIYSSGTGLPFTATEAPASCRGSGVAAAAAVAVSMFAPKSETSEPGAICGAPLAESTIPAAVITGPAGVIEKDNRFDTPADVETEMTIEPGCEMRLGAIAVDNWLELTQVVESGWPFHKMPAPG